MSKSNRYYKLVLSTSSVSVASDSVVTPNSTSLSSSNSSSGDEDSSNSDASDASGTSLTTSSSDTAFSLVTSETSESIPPKAKEALDFIGADSIKSGPPTKSEVLYRTVYAPLVSSQSESSTIGSCTGSDLDLTEVEEFYRNNVVTQYVARHGANSSSSMGSTQSETDIFPLAFGYYPMSSSSVTTSFQLPSSSRGTASDPSFDSSFYSDDSDASVSTGSLFPKATFDPASGDSSSDMETTSYDLTTSSHDSSQ